MQSHQVVADLVSKVGCGGPLTSGALTVLGHLAEEHAEKLASYALFVSAVLEYLDNMSLGQVTGGCTFPLLQLTC